jgi:hypothetical protein
LERDSAKATQIVKLFSMKLHKRLGINPLPKIENIEKLVNWVSANIRMVLSRPSEAKDAYAVLTAEDALETGKIQTVFDKGEPIFGCGTICDATIALLKTIPGVQNIRHIRTTTITSNPHSIVYFELPNPKIRGGKNWRFLADPFNVGRSFLEERVLEQVGIRLSERIREFRKAGKWQEARSLWDFNQSYADYEKECDFLNAHGRLPTMKERRLLRQGGMV